jgi:hypothetical protein
MANPLSAHALEELRHIAREPLPRQSLNSGLVNKLLSEKLVNSVQLPSPFKVHSGRNCEHLEITDLGKTLLG